MIEGVIWQVPEPVQPFKNCIKYRMVYLVDGERVVGYDNERGKGDHRHLRGAETRYVFKNVAVLLRDFMQNRKRNHIMNVLEVRVGEPVSPSLARR